MKQQKIRKEDFKLKFIHTGDLHIGKVVNGFSMLEEQKNALRQIIDIAIERKADAVIIAGDIYDRSVPPFEAVEVLDGFISRLSKEKIKVFIISGNHDSQERLSFANKILEKQEVYIEGTFNGTVKKVELKDKYGRLNIYLLPFIKPSSVRLLYKEDISTYEEAVSRLICDAAIDEGERNIIVTHYFVTNGGEDIEHSDSESSILVGGIDNVDASVFKCFDYTALGHIHGPQKIGSGNVFYAGSPIKYSFSEVQHKKGVNLVELKEKGNVVVERIQLKPIHDMRKLKGKMADLISEKNYSLADTNDYIMAVLTDEDDIFDPIGTLRGVYPNIMQLVFEKNIKKEGEKNINVKSLRSKSTLELYEEFYSIVSDKELDLDRRKIIMDTINIASGGKGNIL